MKLPKDLSPSEWAGQIDALGRQPAWASLCERYAEEMAEVQEKINNVGTTPFKTQEYKRAMERLKLAHPDLLLKDLMNTARNAAKKSKV